MIDQKWPPEQQSFQSHSRPIRTPHAHAQAAIAFSYGNNRLRHRTPFGSYVITFPRNFTTYLSLRNYNQHLRWFSSLLLLRNRANHIKVRFKFSIFDQNHRFAIITYFKKALIIRNYMAPTLRSRKQVTETQSLVINTTSEVTQIATPQSVLNSSFNLPQMGADTQAIMEEIVQEDSELADLDNLIEEDFLIFSPTRKEMDHQIDPISEHSINEEAVESCSVPETSTKVSSAKKRGRKPKQPKNKKCPICPKTVNFMRQHLIKAHGWSGRPLHFILSVFATQNLKTPVYECETCLSRFTHRQRHIDKNTGCEVQRITRDNTNCYPAEVIEYMKDKRVLSERGYEVMCQYQEYCSETLKKPLQNFQFEFISRVFKDTQSFKRVDQVSQVFNDLKKEKTTHSVLWKNFASTSNLSCVG